MSFQPPNFPPILKDIFKGINVLLIYLHLTLILNTPTALPTGFVASHLDVCIINDLMDVHGGIITLDNGRVQYTLI